MPCIVRTKYVSIDIKRALRGEALLCEAFWQCRQALLRCECASLRVPVKAGYLRACLFVDEDKLAIRVHCQVSCATTYRTQVLLCGTGHRQGKYRWGSRGRGREKEAGRAGGGSTDGDHRFRVVGNLAACRVERVDYDPISAFFTDKQVPPATGAQLLSDFPQN